MLKAVPIDTLMLDEIDSSYLQQTSQLTGGIYIKPQHKNGVLQYLLVTLHSYFVIQSCFLADAYARKFMAIPSQGSVDYKASCFCHKRVIDIGYVCTVCLSSKAHSIS